MTVQFILTIVIVLLASKIAGQISIRLGQPSVLGKIIAGIVLGPALLGWIQPSDLITEFSEIGVLLLMFLAGLETDVKSLNQNMKSAVTVAVMGVIMPILLGWAGVAQEGRFALERKLDYLVSIEQEVIRLFNEGNTSTEICQKLFPKKYPIIKLSRGEWDSIHIVNSILKERNVQTK